MSSKPPRHPGEGVFAAVLIVFSLAALWQAYEISGFSGLSTAGVFPMLAAGAMLLSALCIALRSATIGKPSEKQRPAWTAFLREVTPLRHVAMITLIALYLLAMPWLGFVISSALFLFTSLAFLWRRSLWLSLVLTAVSLGAVYGIFRVLFQVVLPQGTVLRGLF